MDVNQFLTTIYRYIQLGVHIKAYYSKERGKFHRELDEVCEFYVDDNNVPQSRVIYQKIFGREPVMRKPSAHLLQYLENQNIDVQAIVEKLPEEMPITQQADFSNGDTTEETTPGLHAPGTPAAPSASEETQPVATLTEQQPTPLSAAPTELKTESEPLPTVQQLEQVPTTEQTQIAPQTIEAPVTSVAPPIIPALPTQPEPTPALVLDGQPAAPVTTEQTPVPLAPVIPQTIEQPLQALAADTPQVPASLPA